MSDGNGTQRKDEPSFGLFGGTGPVLGGSAGGKDYSIGSMLDQAGLSPPEGKQGAKLSGVEDRGNYLGGPVMSSGTQDLLEGSGLLAGDKSGFKEGARTSLAKARLAERADVSKADEDARGFAAEGAPVNSGSGAAAHTSPGPGQGSQPQQQSGSASTFADAGSAGWSAEGAKGPTKSGNGGAKFTREEKRELRGQGLMSMLSEGDARDTGRKGSEPLGASNRLAEKEIDLLHGQGITGKGSGQGRAGSAPEGLGSDAVPTSGTPEEGFINKEAGIGKAGGGDSEDELAKEQTEIPEEEFEKLPSAADAVWDVAGQVADKAKSLISGGTTEE